MVVLLVCKNDGCFEFEQADIALESLATWSDVKMALARVLYCEEELFAVTSPTEIALYRLPDGESVGKLTTSAASDTDSSHSATDDNERAAIARLLVSDSRWVLDIFNRSMQRMSDLTQQTDHAIRGMRKSNRMPPLDRRTSALSPSPVVSPNDALGNERMALDTPTAPAATHHQHHRSASTVIATIASANSTMYHEPYIHIGTWVPLMATDKPNSPRKYASPSKTNATSVGASSSCCGFASVSHVLKTVVSSEYEDVLVTTARAREYINRFRRVGRPVTILSLQTTLLPLTLACPNAITHNGPRRLYDGVFTLSESDAARGFVQAVRLWFSFDCEQTVSVTKVNGALGLKPLRQQDGWIVVQALPGSPASDAGMRDDEAFLTHVNGVDVSPLAFPAIGSGSQTMAAMAPAAVSTSGQTHVSWKDSVIPLVEKCETCIFTFF